MNYLQASIKHPGCVIELKCREVNAAHRVHERVPTATVPAIFIWPDQDAADTSDENDCVAKYWLLDDE